MRQEDIVNIATKSNFICISSCCNVQDKFCSGDIWRGSIAVLADQIECYFLDQRDPEKENG